MTIWPELVGAASLLALILGALLALVLSRRIAAISGSFGSLLPHISLALVGSAIVLALLGAPVRAVIALGAGLLGATVVGRAILRAGRRVSPPAEGATISVATFNIHNLNFANGERIAQLISSAPRELFVVIEANPIAPHYSEIARAYPGRVGVEEDGRQFVVFSRLPILDSEIYSASAISPDRILRLSVAKGSDVITVFACHMTKPYFDGYGLVELDWLADRVRDIAGPVVVVGDFNQTSWSPMLAGFLVRTNLRTVRYEPATWPAAFGIGGIPIDHIFAGGGAEVVSVSAIRDPLGSNHRGLHGTIRLPV